MLTRVDPFHIEFSTLSGRDIGAKIRRQILIRLEELPPDSVLSVDFSKVKILDFSCADEILATTLRRSRSGELGTRYVVLTNLSETVRENVQAVLELRGLACISEIDGEQPEVLGAVKPQLLETFRLSMERGRITARDLVEVFKLTISAASNRLTKLQELGLITRIADERLESGGRQFIYEPVR